MRATILLHLMAGVAFTGALWAQGQNQVLANAGLGVGARAMGMGGAFTAVAAGPTAMYWNPAGLSQRSDLQIDFGVIGQVDNLRVFQEARDVLDAITTDDFTATDFDALWRAAGRLAGQPVQARASVDLLVSFGHLALGGYGQAAGDAVLTRTPRVGDFDPLRPAQVTVDGTGLAYYAIGGAYGRRVHQRLAVGVTLKELHVRRAAARFVGSYMPPSMPTTAQAPPPGYSQTDSNETSPEDTTWAADLGLLCWPKVEGYDGRFLVGLMCRNLNAPTVDLPLPTVDARRRFTFDRTYSVGVAGYSPDRRWLFAADMHNLTGANDAPPTSNVGVEYRPNRWLALRLGLSDWTCTQGVGLDLGFLQLDAAMAGRYDRLLSFNSSLSF